jgi:hypothetical protein
MIDVSRIRWHVDNVKISHVNKEVVDSIINDLEGKFGKESPLSKSRGRKHDYLEMILDYSVLDLLPFPSSYLYKINVTRTRSFSMMNRRICFIL